MRLFFSIPLVEGKLLCFTSTGSFISHPHINVIYASNPLTLCFEGERVWVPSFSIADTAPLTSEHSCEAFLRRSSDRGMMSLGLVT